MKTYTVSAKVDYQDIRSVLSEKRSRTVITFLSLAGMMLLPVALSYFYFIGQGLRLDESQSIWQVSRSLPDIFAVVASDVHVPLYHTLLHFWLLCIGDNVFVARSMSLLFYLISIPSLYFLGKRAFNHTVGLFAAFLFSISPFMNWYGNEVRMYTLLTLLVVLNQYFFVRIFKDVDVSEHVWVWYTLTGLLGVFSHYFFFLNLTSQAVFYFLRYDLFPTGSLRRFVLSATVIGGAFTPWAWYVLHLGQAGFSEPSLATPTSVDLFSTFSQFLFGFQNDNLNTVLLSLWPITVIFGLFTLRRGKRVEETEYFLTTILVSFVIAFIVSFTISPVFVSRYLIFTIPSLYLLLASLFSHYSPRFSTVAHCSLVGLMLLTLWIEMVNPTTPVKENYKEASLYLNSHVTAQDVVVLSAPFTVYPIEYYYRGTASIMTLPIWNQYTHGAIPTFSPNALPGEVLQVTRSSQNVYLLLSYNQGYEKNIKNYFEDHFQRLYTQTFSNDLTLYVYKLRYDTGVSAISTTLN